MPSLIPGYEYDIFISYRHKDNKGDHWVTEFVEALRTELESTFKEDISIYFDSNPKDGLLETHDVDESLRSKLKCLVFIPIISQTYCDPKSFAWKNEFLEFRKSASEDRYRLKIKLPNGNVGSRILPVCIHELDMDDKKLLENELGGVLRGIDFIYRTPGVVRPLKPHEENPKGNSNQTFYHDQLNKVARSIKDLIVGMRSASSSPVEQTSVPSEVILPATRRKVAFAAVAIIAVGLLSFTYYYFGGFGSRMGSVMVDKSIAVLPFANMNRDSTQDYFSDGITEDILNHLTKISDLKVKSRTSTLQYANKEKPIPEIGEELGVVNVVRGSVRREGDNVRIVVELVDAKTDVALWSESYDREVKDVLKLQSEIAIEIANALKARLTETERKNIETVASYNIDAYDYFLKAREGRFSYNGTKSELGIMLQVIDQAIKLDMNFSEAFALKARAWFNMRTFGVPQKTWQDSAIYYSNKAISLNPTSPEAYLVQGSVYRYIGNIQASKSAYSKAYEIAPGNPDVLSWYGPQVLRAGDERGADMLLKSIVRQHSLNNPEYYISMSIPFFQMGQFDNAEIMLDKAKAMGENSLRLHSGYVNIFWWSNQYEKGLKAVKDALKINPESTTLIDDIAWLSYLTGDFETAAKYWGRYKEIEDGFEDSTQTVAFRHRLAMAYLKLGKKEEADALVKEDLKIRQEQLAGKRGLGAWFNYGSVFYDMAVDQTYLGNYELAVQCLDSALHRQHTWDWGYHNDPMFEKLKDREDFKKLLKRIDDFSDFRAQSLTNAMNRMQASGELKNIMK